MFSRYLKISNPELLNTKHLEKFKETLEILDIAGVKLRKLPADLFSKAPKLKWLDLRDNSLMDLPGRKDDIESHNLRCSFKVSLTNHSSLEVLLLDNNLFSELPSFLCTLPRLRVLGLRQNLLEFPKYLISNGEWMKMIFKGHLDVHKLSRFCLCATSRVALWWH